MHQDALVEAMLAAMPTAGSYALYEGLTINRVSDVNAPHHSIPKPAFCVIAQGKKVIHLGNDRFVYDPDHFLIASVDLPTVSQVVEASPNCPYLSLRMEFDATMVAEVLRDAGNRVAPHHGVVRALDVGAFDPGLRDAVTRLVQVARQPDDAPMLVPLVQREIIYRLLVGEQGPRLQQVVMGHIATDGIARAIAWMRKEYDQVLRIERIANDLGMSVSGFHHQFKAVTGMSPLQFQKQLRLQEARRLMAQDGHDATTAGRLVGYGSLSQFNREYKRQFGEPPLRDITRLRLSPSPLF